MSVQLRTSIALIFNNGLWNYFQNNQFQNDLHEAQHEIHGLGEKQRHLILKLRQALNPERVSTI